MARINIYDQPTDYTQLPALIGWFDPDKATHVFDPDTFWNGNNNVAVTTGDQFRPDRLYRTAGGRWVYARLSCWDGERNTYQFVDDDEAANWLLRAKLDDAHRQFFGEVADEKGPAPVGRPAIGPAVTVRLPADVLDRIDDDAARKGQSRAEWLRVAAEQALAGSGQGAA